MKTKTHPLKSPWRSQCLSMKTLQLYIVFDIVYLKGFNISADPDNDQRVLSTFPSFVVEAGKVDRGWMTWSGTS